MSRVPAQAFCPEKSRTGLDVMEAVTDTHIPFTALSVGGSLGSGLRVGLCRGGCLVNPCWVGGGLQAGVHLDDRQEIVCAWACKGSEICILRPAALLSRL